MYKAIAVVLFIVLMFACHEGSGGTPVARNLGIAASAMEGRGDLKVLLRHELDFGDLNGDFDSGDLVAAIYDDADGSLHELGLAVVHGPLSTIGEHLVALRVDEQSQGNSDLNGDGDLRDQVLFVFDRRTGVATNLGLAMLNLVEPAVGVDKIAFFVPEAFQGNQDLDGDGMANHFVWHVYDSQNGTTTSMGAVASVVAQGTRFAAVAWEAPDDLNGDGDDDDSVLQLFDADTGILTTVPVAIRQAPIAAGDRWLVAVEEADQGLDLNGDGDLADAVYHVVDATTGVATSLGFSTAGHASGARSVANESRVALRIQEVDGIDHNNDGDLDDTLWVFHELDTGTSLETGLVAWASVPSVPTFLDVSIGFNIPEALQGEDLNGDGDESDSVFFLYRNGGLENTRIENQSPETALNRFALHVPVNGVGVLHLLHPDTGEFFSTELASVSSVSSVGSGGTQLLLTLEEDEQAPPTDLNGDGDVNDHVWFLYDVETGRSVNLRLAAQSRDAVGLDAQGGGVFLVSEVGQGRDLDGDGVLRSVLYELRGSSGSNP